MNGSKPTSRYVYSEVFFLKPICGEILKSGIAHLKSVICYSSAKKLGSIVHLLGCTKR